MKRTMGQRLWGLAERADWNGLPPRRFWRRLLVWCDRRWGPPDGISKMGGVQAQEQDQASGDSRS